MKKFLKRTLSFLIILLLCLNSFIAFSHPGSLDSNSGHWDRQNGTYHYHKGTHTESSSVSEPGWFYFFVFLIIAVAILMRTYFHLPYYHIDSFKSKMIEFQNYQNDLHKLTPILNSDPDALRPDAYVIGSDNLPKERDCSSGWGKTFTLYRTPHGSKLHAKPDCYSFMVPVNIGNYIRNQPLSKLLCQKCTQNYVIPNLSWYIHCLDYHRALSRSSYIEKQCIFLRRDIKHLYKKCNSINSKLLMLFSAKTKKALKDANTEYNHIVKDL